jgi:tetratricopeptide (TPR) repeat protein
VSLNYCLANVLVVIQMMSKKQLVVLIMLVVVIVATAPVSAILYGQDQIQATPAEQLVDVTDRAEQQVKNVALHSEGVGDLTAAHDAFELGDYQGAVGNATQALSVFREVFSSTHMILEEAGLQEEQLVDSQGLLEATTRQLQRIYRLKEVLPEDAPAELTQLLDAAEALLDIDAARTLLVEGKTNEARDTLQEAEGLISQVYDYLKAEAEELNAWRIGGYCERAREGIQERFRNGNQLGIDFTDVLEAQGYQSESQFMETLQNMIQTAEGKTGDFNSALQDLDAIGQMVQEMDQALTEKMNQHMSGSSGNMGGSSDEGSGNIGSGYGQGGSGQ